MLTMLCVMIFGIGAIAFLLWCLYHFHREVSRPHYVRITHVSNSMPASAQVIELPKQSARQQLLEKVVMYRG